jgi:ribosomal subunit interface protein
MRIIYKGKDTILTASIKVYMDEKIARPIEKLVDKKESEHAILEIELGRTTKHHQKGGVWRAEANVTIGAKMFRAESFGESPHEVVDLLENEIIREVKRDKEKKKTTSRRDARKIKRSSRKSRF